MEIRKHQTTEKYVSLHASAAPSIQAKCELCVPPHVHMSTKTGADLHVHCTLMQAQTVQCTQTWMCHKERTTGPRVLSIPE